MHTLLLNIFSNKGNFYPVYKKHKPLGAVVLGSFFFLLACFKYTVQSNTSKQTSQERL